MNSSTDRPHRRPYGIESDMEDPESYMDSAECPSCADALFAVARPGPHGYRWSHEPDEFVECPNAPSGRAAGEMSR